jgi:Cupin
MTDSPEYLAERPARPANLLRSPQEFADPPAREEAALGLDADSQSHDLLSELLLSVRLSGERIVSYAPPRAFSIGFADVGSLHIIDEGELVLRINGNPHVEHVSRGDVVLLPRGDPHHISNAGKRAHAVGRVGSAEHSRLAIRRRATCSRASRP